MGKTKKDQNIQKSYKKEINMSESTIPNKNY